MNRVSVFKAAILLLPAAVLQTATSAQEEPTQPSFEGRGHARLATDLYRSGRYREAVTEQLRAVDSLPPGVPASFVAAAHHNLAQMYIETGELSAAASEAQRALETLDKAIAAEPVIRTVVVQGPMGSAQRPAASGQAAMRASLYSVLARVALASGDLTEAGKQQAKVLAVWERDPSQPLLLATALNDLAMIRVELGDLDGARPLFVRALALLRAGGPPDAVTHQRILLNFGRLCLKQGDYAAATPLYQDCVAMLEADLGPNDPAVCAVLSEQAALFRRTGRRREAKEIEKQIRKAMAEAPERFLGPGTIDARALKR